MTIRNAKVTLVDATEAKNRFGAIMKRAYAGDEHIIVRRGGLPMVAIVPMQDYERLLAAASETQEPAGAGPEVEAAIRAAAARARLREFLAEVHASAPGVSPAEAEADITDAIQATRAAAQAAPKRDTGRVTRRR